MRRSSTPTSFSNVLSETEASFLSLEVNVQETDRCIRLNDGFLIMAEKEPSAFIRAVDKLFGVEQARQSALHWIEELERMDWPCGESDSRLASGYGGSKCSAWRFVVWQWRARTWQARTEIPVSKCCLRCTTLSAATWKRVLVD